MPQYAKDQPAGYKNHVEKVAIIGAGGQSGKFITTALLKAGKHTVTAITREGSTSALPEGVMVKKVNYDQPATLVDALRGQDVLIITLSIEAQPGAQERIIDAAAEAGVPWVIPNEYGYPANDVAGEDSRVGAAKAAARAYIEKVGKSDWIGYACGFWYEFSLAGSADRFGFDFRERSLILFDDGNKKINTSSWPLFGEGVAKLLSLKVLPEDENDRSTTISDFRNDFVKVASFTISQRDMFDSVLRVTGTKPEDWTITHENTKERFEKAVAEFQQGSFRAFGRLLYTRIFYPDTSGQFELDNERLGLAKEDIDEFTREAIRLDEADYFKGLYRER
ncbi:NAD(P)-binding protein [Trichodelitschia bisporula]|uniref:NAD(P)-binding protein n=1 Tax=Trichodelitschia bisporula TaxID=703511 RepID=A0A6G1HI62_9PEZI|nr:NAD(P)-binding protein [Trichodelitschia bisporula]